MEAAKRLLCAAVLVFLSVFRPLAIPLYFLDEENAFCIKGQQLPFFSKKIMSFIQNIHKYPLQIFTTVVYTVR